MLLETDESEQPALWSLGVIKTEIFLDQGEFSELWQKQVLIQQQACIISAALMALHVTPLAPSGASNGPADNEMSQRTDIWGKDYQS